MLYHISAVLLPLSVCQKPGPLNAHACVVMWNYWVWDNNLASYGECCRKTVSPKCRFFSRGKL